MAIFNLPHLINGFKLVQRTKVVKIPLKEKKKMGVLAPADMTYFKVTVIKIV